MRVAVVATMLALGLASASAQSAPPYAGQWAVEGPDACGAGNDDLKTTFSAKQFDYYASACRVTSSRRLSASGNHAHRLKLVCEGEGAKSAREVILIVLEKTEPRPELLLHIDAASWETITYQRCGE